MLIPPPSRNPLMTMFLIDNRLQACLDAVLTRETLSILFESTVWTIAFLFYVHAFSRFLRSKSKYFPFWQVSKKRGGVFCFNAQDDCLLYMILGLHHLVAGSTMIVGTIKQNSGLWRHGYLMETGYEIGDLISILHDSYPYGPQGVKPVLKAAFVFHHLPGVALFPFVLETGLHNNAHLRSIGSWLLIGAFESFLAGLYNYSLDGERQLPKVTCVLVSNVAFFFFCRFVMFPREAYLLLREFEPLVEGFRDTLTLKLLYLDFICLTIFNLGVAVDLIRMTRRYVKRAFDGVTPIDAEPVPLSREEQMKKMQ